MTGPEVFAFHGLAWASLAAWLVFRGHVGALIALGAFTGIALWL